MVHARRIKNELQFLDIIQNSCVTSKAKILNEKQGQIVIYVKRDANKIEIKNAVEKIFGIEVSKIRVMTVKGKNKISARRFQYACLDRKKAIIILKDRSLASQIIDSNMVVDENNKIDALGSDNALYNKNNGE
jgi:large subunit ribosomal protein L23